MLEQLRNYISQTPKIWLSCINADTNEILFERCLITSMYRHLISYVDINIIGTLEFLNEPKFIAGSSYITAEVHSVHLMGQKEKKPLNVKLTFWVYEEDNDFAPLTASKLLKTNLKR